jgi:hypothetical protein
MRRNIVLTTCAAMAFPVLSSAAEQLNVRPGLWDVTQTMTTSGAPLYVEGMTAAARENYAKTWAKDVGKPHTDRDKQCITEKDIKETLLFDKSSQRGKQCTNKVSKQTSTAWAATADCKDEKTTTLSEMSFTAPSPQSFSGAMKSTMTTPNGKTLVDLKVSGKWLAASCPDAEPEASDDSEDSDDKNDNE